MSATADSTIAAPRTGRIDPKYTRDRTKSGNFEMLTWLFMRLSGIVLVVLIFVHLFSNLMVGDGINGLDFGFVAGKWADPFWQFWDLAMLWLAMLHGTNGVRTIIIVLGTLVIFTFEPCLTDAAGNLLGSSPAFCATL